MKIPLFDIDGTLFKTGSSIHYDAFTHAFKTVYGINASQREIQPEGMLDNQIIINVLKLHGIIEDKAKEKLKDATSCMSSYVRKNIKKGTFEPLPGVKELLEKLKETKTPVGVLSGNVEEIAWIKIANAGLRKYFDFGAFGNSAFKRVDLVEIARQNAIRTLNKTFKTRDFIIVGDTPKDIQCAQDAGIKVIAVSTGIYSFEELTDEKPDLTVYSLEDKSVLDFILN